MKRILAVLVLLVVVGMVWLRVRDPESRTLDATARAGVPGQFVRLTDGVTHYEIGGPADGPRVILVHGFSVPAYIWDTTFVALTSAGFRVARYDMFGRGWSDRPDASYSLSMFDRQLRELLDSLGWREPVNVAGLSFGGPVTATFVAMHPERVRSWTLVDPAAGGPQTTPGMFSLPLVGPVLWQGLAMPRMAEGQFTDFVNPSRWPGWDDRYRVQMQYRGFGRALLRTRQATEGMTSDTLYARSGATHVPTLLIWGAEDHTVPIANAAGVRRAIPQVEYHAVDSAGHLPIMERAGVVDPLLIDFLRRHQGTDSATAGAHAGR
jgi:pimeloyl-ACP methyl ester carboxylesterase